VARQDLITKLGSELLESILAKYEKSYDYAAIALGTSASYQ
jgi:hypothetical protein